MNFCWLGVAGIELIAKNDQLTEEVLVIDPYITRAPFRNLRCGQVSPDVEQIHKHMPACNHLLVTHAHFDHVMDAAEIVCSSGGHGYGSPNACRLMAAMGAPHSYIHVISEGSMLEAGHFGIEVYQQDHPSTLIDTLINGELNPNLNPPLRLRDFCMDDSFGFLIQAEGLRLLVRDLPIEADVLFTIPLKSRQYYENLLSIIRPRLIIPIHWDDLFQPLTKRLRPMLIAPELPWPLIRRIDLQGFKRQIEALSSTYRVLIPQIFQPYKLQKQLTAVFA